MSKRRAEASPSYEEALRKMRRRWLARQRNTCILPAHRGESKRIVIQRASELGLLGDLSKKSKAAGALNKIRQALVQDLGQKPVYFYGVRDKKHHASFSNFHKIELVVDRREFVETIGRCLPHLDMEEFEEHKNCLVFHSSEQIFMLFKALCMRDAVSAMDILACQSATKAKALGRKVTPWDDELWNKLDVVCMVEALRIKFRNPPLRQVLLATGDRAIVEAAARDCKWGIGVGVSKAEGGALWRGKNLLGEALCLVRQEFVEAEVLCSRKRRKIA